MCSLATSGMPVPIIDSPNGTNMLCMNPTATSGCKSSTAFLKAGILRANAPSPVGPSIGPIPSPTREIRGLDPGADRVALAGADVFRVNGAHADAEEIAAWIRLVREASAAEDRAAGVLVDLPGPKFRVGALVGDERFVLDQRKKAANEG